MSTVGEVGLAKWHAVVDSWDATGLAGIIAEAAVFRSPALFSPQQGRDLVVKYLAAAFEVLGPHFEYHDEWLRDHDAVLRFTSQVEGKTVEGIDMIRWDDDGQIIEFTVMIRPMSALQVVIPAMAQRLLA